jgi:spore maturation protein CgeB
MSHRILFIASLHHPETLITERAHAQQSNSVMPLFPTSAAQHFWEKVFRGQGYAQDVFWRNLPSRAQNDIRHAKSETFQRGLTLGKIVRGVQNRLPYQANPDLRARNAYLLEFARRFQPTVIWLTGDNRVVFAETLAQLKHEHGCKIITAVGTSPIVFSQALERETARVVDWVLCNDFYHGVQWQELGAKHMHCLPICAIDPDFHQPKKDLPIADFEVSFVGTLLPYNLYSERITALEALRDFRLGIWSVHDVPVSLAQFYRGKALGAEMMAILAQSPITLNTHGDFMRYGGNMRLFEAAAMGAFQLVDNRVGVHEWFRVGEHLVMYDDMADLREKVAYYLAHPQERQMIADAARQHVLAHHTYQKRFVQLLKLGIL